MGSQAAADRGCERDVIRRMNEAVYSAWTAENCVEKFRIDDKRPKSVYSKE